MTSQAINIELPEDIYQRLNDVAASTHRPFREVLVQTIRGNLPPTLADLPPERRDLVADLQMLSDDALWAVAKEELPAPQWRQHQRLLRKAAAGWLTAPEQAALTELREVTDQFVLRRSYALALLKWRGHTILSVR